MITAIIASRVMLVLCLLAAFTAGWVTPERDDNLFAAWVAAAVAAVIYAIATVAAFASFPVTLLVVCSCPIGLVFGCLVLALAPGLADLGAEMRVARLRRRAAG